MISGKGHYCWHFQMRFFDTVGTTSQAPSSTIISKRMDIAMADISKTLQLTLKQSRWINTTTERRKHVFLTVQLTASTSVLWTDLYCCLVQYFLSEVNLMSLSFMHTSTQARTHTHTQNHNPRLLPFLSQAFLSCHGESPVLAVHLSVTPASVPNSSFLIQENKNIDCLSLLKATVSCPS